MGMMMEFRQACLKISTLGPVGELPFGSVIASFYAFILIMLGRGIFLVSPWLSYTLFFIVIGLSVFIMQCALGAISEKPATIMVLDNVIGILIAFAGITLHWSYWKLLLGGFVLYHLFLLLKPLFFFHQALRKVDQLPNVIGIVFDDIFFGLLVNIFFRIGAWIFY